MRLILAACCTLVPSLGMAGVVVEQELTTGGFGPGRGGAMTGTITTQIEGDRARDDSKMEFTGKMLGMLGEMGGTSITRLDKDVVWQLHPKREAYRETTFAELKREREKMLADLARGKEEGETAERPEEGIRWAPPKLEVRKTGASETLAGQQAAQTVFAVTSVGTDTETGETCEAIWTLDTWLAEESPASREVAAFQQRFAGELGFSAREVERLGPQMQAMFGSYGDGWAKVYEELARTGGVSLKTTLSLAAGGACAQEDAASPGSARDEAAPGGLLGMGRKAMGKLRKSKPEEPEEPAPAGKPKTVPLFSMTSSVRSIRQADLASDLFEVPAGWKRLGG